MSNNVQQNYNIGEPFNTYTLADLVQLSAAEWTWPHRTLSCFKSELCGMIQPGSEVTFSAPTAQLSGVWTLDRDCPVVLCCLGATGRVTAHVTERNIALPLANAGHPYESTVDLTSTSTHNMHYESYVSVDIVPDEDTTIKSIKYLLDAGLSPSDVPAGTQITAEFTAIHPSLTIQVDYVQGGVLEYFSNKNTLNPNA